MTFDSEIDPQINPEAVAMSWPAIQNFHLFKPVMKNAEPADNICSSQDCDVILLMV